MRRTLILMGAAALCLAAAESPSLAIPAQQMYFEPNLGQVADGSVQFLTRDGAMQAWFTAADTILAGQDPVRAQFPGAAKKLTFVGENELPGISAYFIGNDKSKWLGRVPHYSRIRAKDVYPGIDLVYYASAKNQLEYDFILHPGADAKQIEISFQGSPIKLNSAGDVELNATLLHKKARVYQRDAAGHEVEVAANYELDGSKVRIALGDYDHSRELTIDPVYINSFTSGTTNGNRFHAVKMDASGNMYAAGTASNATALNAFRVTPTGIDGFIAKYSSTGTLIYATYLGGANDDQAWGLAVDPSGAVHVSGQTYSQDFPAVGTGSTAHVASFAFNAFHVVIAPFSGGTASLSWATTVPGEVAVDGNDVVLDSSGRAHIIVNSATVNGIGLYRIQPGVGIVNQVSIPCNNTMISRNLGIDAAGAVYVSGVTNATDLPTVNALQAAIQGNGIRGFVAKIVFTGANAAVDYLTYVGGNQTTDLHGMAVMPSGKVILAGTGGAASPTPNGAAYNGSSTLWLYALNPRGPGAVTAAYGTFPISSNDYTANSYYHSLTADSQETLYLAGYKSISSGYAFCNQFGCFNFFNFNARRLIRLIPNNGVPVKSAVLDTSYGVFTNAAVSADRTRIAAVGESGYTQNSSTISSTLLETYRQDIQATISTIPSGLSIQVDNVNTFPSTLQWVEGESHTLSVPNVTSNGTIYQFSSWTEGGTQPKTVSPGSSANYQAVFTPFKYFLQVIKSGNGSIGGNSDFYLAGSVQVVTATPAAGWTFSGWSGACSGTGTCFVAMNGPQSLTATFVPTGVTPTSGGPLSLAVVSKTGSGGTRIWEMTAVNLDTAPVTNAALSAFTMTQTGGAACTPVPDIRFANFGTIASGTAANNNVIITFTGCPANARFTVNATVSANGGTKTGSVTLLNQFQ